MSELSQCDTEKSAAFDTEKLIYFFTKRGTLMNRSTILGPYSQHFIFFMAHGWPNTLECLAPASLSGLMCYNALAYCVYSLVKKRIKCCEYDQCAFPRGTISVHVNFWGPDVIRQIGIWHSVAADNAARVKLR